MSKLNPKSPLQAYTNIGATFVVECLHPPTGYRSGVDRRSLDQTLHWLVGLCGGEGDQISGPIGTSNRMGHHVHKISCGRMIDFFKQQSKKSNEIAGAHRERQGVGGLIRWPPSHCWNPTSYARIFFPAFRIFRSPNARAAALCFWNVESNQRFRREACEHFEGIRAGNLYLFSGAQLLPKAASKKRREIRGGGREAWPPKR